MHEVIVEESATGTTVLLDGTQVGVYENPQRSARGGFGLQCRGTSTVRFKRVEVKELPR